MQKLYSFRFLLGLIIFNVLIVSIYPAVTKAFPKNQHLPPTDVNQCLLCHASPSDKVKVNSVEFEHSPYINKKINCSFCHSNIIQGQGEALADNCFSCHASAEFVEKMSQIKMIHQVHVTRNRIRCINCHERIVHPAGEKITHWKRVEEKAWSYRSCSSCHGSQHLTSLMVYTGRAIKDISPQPAVMAEVGLTCQACHQEKEVKKINRERTQITLATTQACDTCHGKGFGKVMIPMWQKPIRKKYENLTERINQVKKKISKKDEQAYRLLNKAEDIIALVKADGSWGVHNPNYTNLLLKRAEDYLNKVKGGITNEAN